MVEKKYNSELSELIMRRIRKEFNGEIWVSLDWKAVYKILETARLTEQEFARKEDKRKDSDEKVGWFPGDCYD